MDKPTLIELRGHTDSRGRLSIAETMLDIPFGIRRCYWIYGVPEGKRRGGHAHKSLRQLIVAASGSFEVMLDDGHERQTITLDRPDRGVIVNPLVWRTLSNFSEGAVCLVLASDGYDESDYIRDYDEFRKLAGSDND